MDSEKKTITVHRRSGMVITIILSPEEYVHGFTYHMTISLTVLDLTCFVGRE
jgi:hypothetical protein